MFGGTFTSCSCASKKGGGVLGTEFLNKEFVITSVTRADLVAAGFPKESDEQMEQIAEELSNRYLPNDFEEDVLFVARLVLAEKEQLHDSEEPMRETSDA